MTDLEAMAQVFAAQTRALLYNLQPDVITDRKIKQQKIENCFYVEWEQDMGRKIPFCKITGEYCSGQCNFCPELQREYEAAVEAQQYCERYEPTYNPDDGSM